MQRILIIGATSAIATDVARAFSQEACSLFLVGRSGDKLERLAEDLKARGARDVHTHTFDASDLSTHSQLMDKAVQALGTIDGALIAHGFLPNQAECQIDWEKSQYSFQVNLYSQLCFLTYLANYFESQRAGCLAVISSVAGDRGRQSNYVYGAAKSALSIFVDGVRNRLYPAGVKVVTIKPGFVDTPMTEGLKKGPLFASSEVVGKRIHAAMKSGADVVYVPWFWRIIMTIICAIPESIFKRMKL